MAPTDWLADSKLRGFMIFVLFFFLLLSIMPAYAQEQPSLQALLQAAYGQAQRCMMQVIMDDARKAEMQAQIDALKQQLAMMQKAQDDQKKEQP